MQRQPVVEMSNGRCFGSKALTPQTATFVINNKTVTSFAVKTLEALDVIRVSRGRLHNEAKVNGDSLHTLSSTARIGFAVG